MKIEATILEESVNISVEMEDYYKEGSIFTVKIDEKEFVITQEEWNILSKTINDSMTFIQEHY